MCLVMSLALFLCIKLWIAPGILEILDALNEFIHLGFREHVVREASADKYHRKVFHFGSMVVYKNQQLPAVRFSPVLDCLLRDCLVKRMLVQRLWFLVE